MTGRLAEAVCSRPPGMKVSYVFWANSCLENYATQEICRQLGFETHYYSIEDGVVEASIILDADFARN